MTSDELKAELARINTLSGDEAVALVRDLVADVSEKIALLAAAWTRAENQGKHDALARMRGGVLKFLPKVSDGSVLPQIVAMFGGSLGLLKLVADLKLTHQRAIAGGQRYEFATLHNGAFDTIKVSVPDLSNEQAQQLFDGSEIRNVAQQRLYLETATTPVRRGASVTAGKVVVDSRTETVRIGRSSSPAADVIRALAAAGLIEPPKKQRAG